MYFLATQYAKISQEAQMCLNRTQEHKNQTADDTIFYFAKGFEGVSRVLPKSNKTSSYIEDHSKDSLTRDPCVS